MRLIEIDWQPDARKLKQFGLSCLLILPLAAWLSGFSWSIVGWVAVGSSLLAATAMVAPRLVRPVYGLAMLITLPLGLVLGELALLLIFVGVFVPIGLVFGLLGRDALSRRVNRQSSSYWENTAPPSPPRRYYRRY